MEKKSNPAPPKEIKNARSCAFVVYKEDVSRETLEDALIKLGYPCLVSPLHSPSAEQNTDEDITTDDGELKKEHWHVLVSLPYPMTRAKVNRLFTKETCYAGGGLVQLVKSYTAYSRYLVHLDDPLKQQFTELPIALNGALFKSTDGEGELKEILVLQLEARILAGEFDSYKNMFHVLLKEQDYDSLKIARGYCVHLSKFFKQTIYLQDENAKTVLQENIY